MINLHGIRFQRTTPVPQVEALVFRARVDGLEIHLGCDVNWDTNFPARRSWSTLFQRGGSPKNHRSGSDHSQIRPNINGKIEQLIKRNSQNTNRKGYRKELSQRIQGVPNNYKSHSRLEVAPESFEEAIKLSRSRITLCTAQLRRAWNKVKDSYENSRK